MIKQLYKKFNAIFPLTRQGKAGFFDAPDLNPDDVMTSSMIDIQKLDPAKSADIIKNLFNNESFFEKEVSDWAIKYLLGHIEHYKDLINHVRKIYVSENVKRLLDIGGVPGHIAALLKHAGFEIEVVDIKPERASGLFDYMHIPYYKVDIECAPLPFSNDVYDLVIFSEILEHLRFNPLMAIEEIRRVLRPGGFLLLSTPQITPLMRLKFLLGHDYQDDIITEYAKLNTIGHMGHIRLYSMNEVENILKHFDFKIVYAGSGGKLSGRKYGLIVPLLRLLYPGRMRAQLYVLAKKL